ncbi:MAG: 2-oxoacid:acceptor oxidoreductase family protein [Desulfobacterium sp.]|nr:2-oxoacid:acceptor oxidoreductase family protein [Desulfobacterium sp.]
MDEFNAYLIGVGGQGIGLLSEVLIRAADHAGLRVKGVDTHGLAQRGGTVISHLRMGDRVSSPMVPRGKADLVVALERNEALRGVNTASKKGGALVYYDTVWQPLGVRLGHTEPVGEDHIGALCRQKDVRLYKVYDPELVEPRMQNIVVLATVAKHGLIPTVLDIHYRRAMADLMQGNMLTKNMALFDAKI